MQSYVTLYARSYWCSEDVIDVITCMTGYRRDALYATKTEHLAILCIGM